jgi:hypothetical protein
MFRDARRARALATRRGDDGETVVDGLHRECRASVARELRSGDDEIDARRRSVGRSVGWMVWLTRRRRDVT